MFCMKWLAKLTIFIILVLISEFVVVAILSEWWLIYLGGDRSRPLPTTVGMSLSSTVYPRFDAAAAFQNKKINE